MLSPDAQEHGHCEYDIMTSPNALILMEDV